MRKLVYMLVFAAIGLSVYTSLQTTPVQTQQSIPSLFAQIEESVQKEDWSKAKSAYARLVQQFGRRRALIMFNNAEQDLNDFEAHLSMIRGGLKAEDKATVLAELAGAEDLWEPLTDLIPRP